MPETLSPYKTTLDGTKRDALGRPVAHLKTGSPQGLVGSNPTPSAFVGRGLPEPGADYATLRRRCSA